MTFEETKPYIDFIDTPIGFLWIEADDRGLNALSFEETKPTHLRANSVTEHAKRELTEYFAGKRHEFTVPLAAKGTDFQTQVWEQLSQIPFGKTCSYLDIATAIGNVKACRAVGAANGKNPIPVIVPCHRVIGSNQKLTGFAGGLGRKAWLLKHENAFDSKEVKNLVG